MLSNQSKNEFQNNVGGQKKKTQVTFMANDKKENEEVVFHHILREKRKNSNCYGNNVNIIHFRIIAIYHASQRLGIRS